jgi:hypothetical protein
VSAVACISILLGCTVLFGIEYRWPVRNISLTATFGEDRWGHFHSGIDLGGGEQEIYPVAEGELIFAYEENAPSSQLPSGMGSFTVLEHSGGVRSLYAHLKNGSMERDRIIFDPGVSLGLMGATGSSLGVHLHFTIIDSDTDDIINPLLLLPPRIDTSRPIVNSLTLVRGPERVPLENSGSVIPSGRWELQVEMYDQSDGIDYFWPMAPFRVMVYLNGSEAVYCTYEYLSYENGEHYLVKSPGFSYDSFYRGETLVSLGNVMLNPGETRIEVVVSDFAGNETILQRGVVVR